jgi:HK97 family phage prohead protease
MRNNVITKYFTKEPDEVEDRILRFVGSNEEIDRDNEKIVYSAWKLKNYKKNPVILMGHNYQAAPVAKAKKVWVDKQNKSLMFDIEFPEPEVSSIGDSLYKLYKNGFMSATSVGFRPNPQKIKYGKEGTDEPWRTFNEVELLELSLVSVPANPTALLTSKSMEAAKKKGVIDDIELEEILLWFEENTLPEEETKEIEKIEPNEGETEEDFISRCMSSQIMIDEFPDEEQRIAVCHSTWRDKHTEEIEHKIICTICRKEFDEMICQECVDITANNYFEELFTEISETRSLETQENSQEVSTDEEYEEVIEYLNE